MIDSIGTSSGQSTSLRSLPQNNTVAPASASIANPSNFVNSRVYVDNVRNVAILQYLDNKGAVLRQYPTEAQIQAFKRAEALAAAHAQDARQEQPVHTESSGGGHSAPAPSSGGSSAPAPAPSAPSTNDVISAALTYTPSGGTGDTGGGSTQSVVV